MSITFCLGNSREELQLPYEYMVLWDEQLDYMYENRDAIGRGIEWLLNLDPYGDTLLTQSDIESVLSVCVRVEEVLWIDKEIATAIGELAKLCHAALQQEKCILAIGD